MVKKSDLIKQNEEMRTQLLAARKFIIITLVGLGFQPETLPTAFRKMLQDIDDALGIKEKKD